MSASATAAARLAVGRAQAVQLPLAPVTARPHARTAPPSSRDVASLVWNIAVRVLVEPADVLTRPSDEPPGQEAPSFHDRSSQISSPAAPLPMAPQARPRLSMCSAIRRPLIDVSGTGCVSPWAT